MDAPADLRCTLTSELVDRGEAEVAAALAGHALRRQEALRPWRERSEPWLRWGGLALCAAGALLSGFAVVVTPEVPCPRGALPGGPFYQLATPLFAALAVPFWFLPRVGAALRAWVPGAAARRAPRLLAPLRRHLPTEVAYRLEGGCVASTLSRPPRRRVVRLADVRAASVGGAVACLFGAPPLDRLRQVVWLAGPAERAAVLAALRDAGVPVAELPAPGPAPSPPPSP